ncbi:unnamed protein product [Protopolystoma xenopodis]|uniref:Uncharacterized protein n=1 Tax=Protopolystoma xenopodis TaxID=117903 RepID=A0A448XMR8_9PLAT|nr:unnamed protein product [Protopolystoma xenopodis]
MDLVKSAVPDLRCILLLEASSSRPQAVAQIPSPADKWPVIGFLFSGPEDLVDRNRRNKTEVTLKAGDKRNFCLRDQLASCPRRRYHRDCRPAPKICKVASSQPHHSTEHDRHLTLWAPDGHGGALKQGPASRLSSQLSNLQDT